MTIRATVTTAGLQKLGGRFTNAINYLGTSAVEREMQNTGDQIVDQYRANIDSFTPGPVPDLAESTKRQKARKFGHVYPILKASGEMYNAMVARVSLTRAAGWVINIAFRSGARSARKNTDIAGYHIEGTPRMPKRDFTKLRGRSVFNGLVSRLRSQLGRNT